MTRLLNDFRSLTRWPAPHPRPTQLATVIAEVLAMEAPRCTVQNITVEQMLPPNLPPVAADNAQLTQALQNLCANTIEALPQGETLTTRAQHISGQVLLDVHDTGVGVPTKLDIFAPFVTTKTRGTGFGLISCAADHVRARWFSHIRERARTGNHFYVDFSGCTRARLTILKPKTIS